MSVAEYRRLKTKQQASQKTFEVESPSGMIWVLRLPNLENFLVSGTLPLALVEKMQQAKSDGLSEEDAYKQLSAKEQIKAIEFSAKILRHICVDPLIVDNPQADNEISAEEITSEDFIFLLNWANTGGGESVQDGLDTFSGK